MTEDQFNEAMTMFSDALAKMDDALKDIAESLRVLKEATIIEIGIKQQQLHPMQTVERDPAQMAKNAGQQFVAGGHPLRDGDTYGIVAAQPKTATSPEPAVHADHPTGHLRSSDEC